MEDFITWPYDLAQKYRTEGFWLDKTISEVLDECFQKYSENTALIGGDGRSYSYKELGNITTRLALHLQSIGLECYDKIVLQLPNIPEVVISYLAILKAGCIPIMALPAHRETEIKHFVKHPEAKALIIADKFKDFDYQDMASKIQRERSCLNYVLVTGKECYSNYYSIDELLNDKIEDRINARKKLPRPDPDYPAVLQLSGGTTGLPKLIPRTHNDYVHNFMQCAEVCSFDENTRVLIAIPQLHNFAIACPGLKSTLYKGGCEILSSSPAPKSLLKLIEDYYVTHLQAVPAMILSILNEPDFENYNLKSLKTIISGGSKLGPEVATRAKKNLECNIQEVLGFAEGPLFFTRLDDPEEVKMHTQGRPISPGNEFKIVDPTTEQEVSQGNIGELIVRGPHTIRGYFRAPDHNVKDFTSDGFYKTGDLVKLHYSSNVIYEGRTKDTINRGGEMISAEEVEDHILAHPNVQECSVVGMPDSIMGEKVCAFVVSKPNISIILEELTQFLLTERKIAKFKLPERLEVVDKLPQTKVGKIDKNQLKEAITSKLQNKNSKQ